MTVPRQSYVSYVDLATSTWKRYGRGTPTPPPPPPPPPTPGTWPVALTPGSTTGAFAIGTSAAGTYSFNDFPAGSSGNGLNTDNTQHVLNDGKTILVEVGVMGKWLADTDDLSGAGMALTVYKMNANTSTKLGNVPGTSAPWTPTNTGHTSDVPPKSYVAICTNPMTAIRVGKTAHGWTLIYTVQGHWYNGIRSQSIIDGVYHDIQVLFGGNGAASVNPDETFGWNIYKCTRGSFTNMYMRSGGSAWATNSCPIGPVVTSCAGTGDAGAAWAGYKTTDTTLIDFEGFNSGRGLNWELMNGIMTLTRPNLHNNVNPKGAHICIGNGVSSGTYLIQDGFYENTPVNNAVTPLKAGGTIPASTKSGKCAVVWLEDTYQSLANKQVLSSIKRYVSGTDVSHDHDYLRVVNSSGQVLN